MRASSSLPEVLPEEQRLKSAYAMPGGGGYLTTLRKLCEVVARDQPSRDELAAHLRSELAISSHNSNLTVGFLLRVDLLEEEAGRCRLGNWTRRWMDNGDQGVVIALLHSRVRFIGEILEEIRETPRSTSELRAIANQQYGFRWKQDKPVTDRRSWLQSAGFVAIDTAKKLTITEAGRAFLARLGAPTPPGPVTKPEPTRDPQPAPPTAQERVPAPSPAEYLATEVEESSIDSQNPDRFERAVRDAFDYLGYRAGLLAGSGQTDVLLTARLGRSDSYKVTVDAKTTASGHLKDLQVDWATLVEHRTNEGADYSLLVGPDPRGARLFNRAADHGVTVLAAHRLAELCLSHARAPLGLADYRLVFTNLGGADLTELNKRAADTERLRLFAAEICRELADRGHKLGYHTARDLRMVLSQPNEDMIQSVLDALASPLVGAIQGNPEEGYVLATDPKVAQLRLTLLGEDLTSPESGSVARPT